LVCPGSELLSFLLLAHPIVQDATQHKIDARPQIIAILQRPLIGVFAKVVSPDVRKAEIVFVQDND
jgi:hypothetical protein